MESRFSRAAAGIAWMIIAGLNFVAVTAIVKTVGQGMPPAQAALLRYLLGLVFVMPMLRPILRLRMDRKTLALFSWRGAAHAAGVMLWFFAMTRITIAEVTAMSYLTPAYVTVGAVLFLGERLAYRRILAVLAAFAGAVIILRPGFRELSAGHTAMLGAAVFFAVSYLTAKRMSDTMDASVIVGMLSVTVPVVLLPFAAAVWITPTMTQMLWLFLVAAFATAGHYTMTLAFRSASVSVTQPATFLQLVWASLLGALVFGEAADIWVIAGGTVIIGSVCFIAWREAVVAYRARRGRTGSG